MNRKDLRDDLKQLQRNDLQDIAVVQNHVVGISMGVRPFEHPGAPNQQPGQRYTPNSVELDFTRRSKSTIYSNFFRVAFVGGLTPFLTLRLISMTQRRVIARNRYLFWCGMGASIGGVYGLTLGKMIISRDYLKLQGSPLATEARYQLWKMNPQHPFLKGFDNEVSSWREYSMYNDNDNDNNDNNQYDDNVMRVNRNRGGGGDRRGFDDRDRDDDYNDMFDDRNNMNNNNSNVRTKKRNQFYSNKNKLDNKYGNSYSDEYDDIHNTFGDHSTPQEDVSDFFGGSDRDFDNKQKWD